MVCICGSQFGFQVHCVFLCDCGSLDCCACSLCVFCSGIVCGEVPWCCAGGLQVAGGRQPGGMCVVEKAVCGGGLRYILFVVVYV